MVELVASPAFQIMLDEGDVPEAVSIPEIIQSPGAVCVFPRQRREPEGPGIGTVDNIRSPRRCARPATTLVFCWGSV